MNRVFVLLLTATIVTAGLLGCEKPEPPEDHVWKDQTDTMDRAKALEEQMQKDAERRRKEMEDAGG